MQIRHWNAVNAQRVPPGKPVTLRFPSEFPIRTPLALRCSIVEPGVVPFLYRASWAENVPISSDKALADTLGRAGFDAESIISQASSQPVKDQLRKNTDEAKELGLCGAPGYRV